MDTVNHAADVQDAHMRSGIAPQTNLPILSPQPPEARPSLVGRAWRHRWFFLAAFAVVGVLAPYAVRLALGPAVVVDRAVRGALLETVVASGHVENPYRVEIGSQITGTVAEVLVDEGQHVVAGQPLIALDARELSSTLTEAEGVLAQAEARMRQLKELTLPSARQALVQAQATEREAQLAYDRIAALVPAGFETRSALDSAQKNLDVAHAQVRTAALQVFSASPGGSDYVTALTQLNQAKASRDAAQSRLTYATIAAPRAGTLIARSVERGTVVQPGKALLVLAPGGDTQIVLSIDERNLGKLALGQQAVVSADAYPQQRFPATVTYINPGIDITKASVEVKLTVPDPPAYLRQDMTVSVDIEVARKDDALTVPARSIRDALAGTPWVMGFRNHRAYRQPVELGIRGTAYFEVLKGVAQNAIVIPATSGVRIGQRLRPVSP
jgi:HlyD family secretion protein